MILGILLWGLMAAITAGMFIYCKITDDRCNLDITKIDEDWGIVAFILGVSLIGWFIALPIALVMVLAKLIIRYLHKISNK